MPNGFSYNKCFEFGKMIVHNKEDPFTGTWEEMIKSKEWRSFVVRREITDKQIHFIKRGFMGLEFDHSNDVHTHALVEGDDQIMPFGTFKGRRFIDLSDKYISWLSKQEWLPKWPSLDVYVVRKMELLNKDAASVDDVKQILHTIE